MRSQLFEFMDEGWVPNSLRMALRDVLEVANSKPFRFYYDWIVIELLLLSQMHQFNTIVELGAGTAPLTRRLMQTAKNLKLIATDINPDPQVYQELASQSKGQVEAWLKPFDFAKPYRWPEGTLVVLSVTFHHLPHLQRIQVIRALEASQTSYVIAESLRYNITSHLYCLFGWVAAVMTPIRLLAQPGSWRRFLWCWFLPLAPCMFMWDGIVSTHRCWSETEWTLVMRSLGAQGIDDFQIKTRPFCLMLVRLFAERQTSEQAAA